MKDFFFFVRNVSLINYFFCRLFSLFFVGEICFFLILCFLWNINYSFYVLFVFCSDCSRIGHVFSHFYYLFIGFKKLILLKCDFFWFYDVKNGITRLFYVKSSQRNFYTSTYYVQFLLIFFIQLSKQFLIFRVVKKT